MRRQTMLAAIGATSVLLGCQADTNRAAVAAELSDAERYPISPYAQEIAARRIWSADNSVDVMGDPAPDGKLVSFVDWDTGDLAVRDVVTNEQRRVTNKGSWEESNDFAEFSVFSRDGRQLAYTWYNDSAQSYQLRVIDVNGSGQRIALSGAGWTQPYDWTPDGQWVLAHTWYRSSGTSRLGPSAQAAGLALIAPNGQIRPIAQTAYPFEAALSPDGRWVAYDAPAGALPNSSPRDVLVISVDGGTPRPVVQGPSHDELLGWLERPNALLVLSDRSGAPALWLQPMSNGAPTGELQLLKPDFGRVTNIGVSGSSFFYFLTLEPQRVVVTEVDIAAARVVSPPVPVSSSPMRTTHPAWSPDGTHLAYMLRPGLTLRRGTLVIRGPEGRIVREMPLPLDNVSNLHWTRDPNVLLANGADSAGRAGIHRVDLRTGGATFLAPYFGQYMRQEQLSPDERTLYFLGADSARNGVFARDLDRGIVRPLFSGGGIGNMALSPDGSMIAFTAATQPFSGHRLLVMPASGGTPRELTRLDPKTEFFPGYSGLVWTPDQKYLLYTKGPTGAVGFQNMRQSVWVIGVDGATPRQLFETRRIERMRLHPDGRRLVYTEGTNRGEVWAIDGFGSR